MHDPLKGFNWESLYSDYDSSCRGYMRNHSFLSHKSVGSPPSDRALYYKLVSLISLGNCKGLSEPIVPYKAMLYWKLYSQPTAQKNFNKWFGLPDSQLRDMNLRAQELFQKMPESLDRDVPKIIELARRLGDYSLPGISTDTALPVRTTLLHFLYPSVVPIFDQMVLKAVKMWEEKATGKLQKLESYIPVAWALSDRHKDQLSKFSAESNLRALDMALWVGRGD